MAFGSRPSSGKSDNDKAPRPQIQDLLMPFERRLQFAHSVLVLLPLALACLMAPIRPLLAQTTQPADVNAMALPIYPIYTGDFDGMKKDRLIRFLVPYSKTIYFLDKGQERGTAAELGRE